TKTPDPVPPFYPVAKAAFGLSATQNGDKTGLGAAGDVGAATAVARALCQSIPPPSTASADVLFWRTFQLAGSPGGWYVSLDGLLDGQLGGGITLDTFDVGSVSGRVRIVPGSFSTYTDSPPGVVNLDFGSSSFLGSVHVPRADVQLLADGTYTVL